MASSRQQRPGEDSEPTQPYRGRQILERYGISPGEYWAEWDRVMEYIHTHPEVQEELEILGTPQYDFPAEDEWTEEELRCWQS